jgi:hypothetical protein
MVSRPGLMASSSVLNISADSTGPTISVSAAVPADTW